MHVDVWQNQYNIVRLKKNNNEKKFFLRNVGDTMGYWIWWALLCLLQGQKVTFGLIYHWAFGALKKKKNKFTGSMRLETSLELEDEWKLTMLCAS